MLLGNPNPTLKREQRAQTGPEAFLFEERASSFENQKLFVLQSSIHALLAPATDLGAPYSRRERIEQILRGLEVLDEDGGDAVAVHAGLFDFEVRGFVRALGRAEWQPASIAVEKATAGHQTRGMAAITLNITDLVDSALAMPRPERSYLVTKLIGSLDDDEDIEVSPEWRNELMRRVEEMRDGTVPGIPHDEVMRGARELLARIQKEKQAA